MTRECESAGQLLYLSDVAPSEPVELFAGEPEAFSLQHAARLLDVSIDTVRREIRRGNLRSFKVGARVRVTRRALAEFVREREGL